MSVASDEPGLRADAIRDSATAAQAGRERGVALITAGIALGGMAIFGVWAVNDGGFAPGQWLPGALAILGMLVAALASTDVRDRLRAAAVPLLPLGLYTVWSYASILWAGVRGDALDGANRTLLYFLVYALFSALPLGVRARGVVVASWAFAIAVIGAVSLGLAAAADSPQGHFIIGRLAAPVTYSNANAALFLTACFLLQVLASRSGIPALVRVAAGAGCAVLADLALLCQSRGSLLALALTLVLYLVVARSVLRSLAHLAVAAVAIAIAAPALLHVYTAVVNGRHYQSTLRTACAWVAISALAAAAGTAGLVLAERRFPLPDKLQAHLRRALAAIAAVALVVAVAGLVAFGHPLARGRHAWDSFTTNSKATPETIHLTAGVGTSRYDVWRIALKQFAQHPLGGVGADNYLVGYLRERRTTETARYPESVELRALSETGAVGALLLLCFLAVALRRAAKVAARRDALATVAIAGLAGFGYWLVHASVDWLWEFPALTSPALAFLALAGSSRTPTSRDKDVTVTNRSRLTRRAALVAASVAVMTTAATLTAPWIAVRETDAALASAPKDLNRAYSLVRSAARWNPLSAQPALAEATIAANAGDRKRERQALLAALRRSGPDTYSYLMLGIVAGQEHRLAEARRYLERAHRLSPRDQVVVYAQRRLRWGDPLTEREMGRIFRLVSRTLRGVVQK